MLSKAAIAEIKFYKDQAYHLKKIDDQLKSLERRSYAFPTRYIDHRSGMTRKVNASVSMQAVGKIDDERSLEKVKEEILQRCQQFEKALYSLSDQERHVVFYIFLDDNNIPNTKKARLLGFNSGRELSQFTNKTLKKLECVLNANY